MSQAGNYADCEICSYKIHGDDADYYWKRRCEAAEECWDAAVVYGTRSLPFCVAKRKYFKIVAEREL